MRATSGLEHRAELIKLARLLGVEPEALPDLSEVDASDLRAFRALATDRLFDATSGTLGAVSKAVKLVPVAVSATVAQKAFGPLLCARTAAAVEPTRAVEIARRLAPEFLTDVAIEIDPRRVADIISELPDDLVVKVAILLGERAEYVTMGRFLTFLSDTAVARGMPALSDEALLHTAFVLEDKTMLDRAVALLDAARMPGILRCAAANGLWPEALDLIDHLTAPHRGPVADAVALLEAGEVDSLVAAVAEADLWDAAQPIIEMLDPTSYAVTTAVAASGGRLTAAE